MDGRQTLTLHETNRPDRPITFTLDGNLFQLDIRALFAPEQPEPGIPPKQPWEERLAMMTKKIIEPFSGPVHVKDVLFLAQGENITVQIWKRARGLRLAPMVIGLNGIDDPQAAANFADLVRERSLAAPRPGRYAGPLDYWGAWALLALGAAGGVVAAAYFLYRRGKDRCD
jgi:hypothetical protein